jgi:hypothetical protein
MGFVLAFEMKPHDLRYENYTSRNSVLRPAVTTAGFPHIVEGIQISTV